MGDKSDDQTPKTYLVETTTTKTFRVTVGAEKGSIRLDGESDEDAAEAIVLDWAHLSEAQMPPYITLEKAEMDVESVIEEIDAKAA